MIPDFEGPISVVVTHSSVRSGLMVENITPQLGEFFGVKNGKGVLVRSVEKGSKAEKAGFRAGDVVVKVNDQAVRDTSDFTHALRSSSGASAAVTVVREKKEQNLNLTLPAKRDSGSLIEDSFDIDIPNSPQKQKYKLGRLATKWRASVRRWRRCSGRSSRRTFKRSCETRSGRCKSSRKNSAKSGAEIGLSCDQTGGQVTQVHQPERQNRHAIGLACTDSCQGAMPTGYLSLEKKMPIGCRRDGSPCLAVFEKPCVCRVAGGGVEERVGDLR